MYCYSKYFQKTYRHFQSYGHEDMNYLEYNEFLENFPFPSVV